jgi:hypothetical protein
MAMTFRADGAIVSWVNSMGIPRRVGDIIVDNLLTGIALDDIAPIDEEVWRVDRKPIRYNGAVIRCGIHTVKMHLTDSVQAWQQAYYNKTLDVVTDNSGSMASMPRPAEGNTGRTLVSTIFTSDETIAEEWYLDSLGVQDGHSRWKLAGTISGTITDQIVSGTYWMDPLRRVGILVTDGDIVNYPPASSDRFTFFTAGARQKFGIFANNYPASATVGEVLLDKCKTLLKRDMHGKYYR